VVVAARTRDREAERRARHGVHAVLPLVRHHIEPAAVVILRAEAEEAELIATDTDNTSAEALAAAGEEAPVIKLANLILVTAIKDKASDIHIEPFEKDVKLRYRVDGALMHYPPPPKNLQQALTSRLKIMASLDISERRLPQDGRMRMKVTGRDIDLRVSFLPTVNGEKCVLRVLDKSNLSASMDKLGLDKDSYRRLKSAVDAPHGLILVTGPTGSGKTTIADALAARRGAARHNSFLPSSRQFRTWSKMTHRCSRQGTRCSLQRH